MSIHCFAGGIWSPSHENIYRTTKGDTPIFWLQEFLVTINMAKRLSLQPKLSTASKLSQSIESANFPSVSINENGTTVVVYQSSGKIFYIVGQLSSTTEGSELDWGQPEPIADGCNVQVAINNHDEVVIVYSENWWRVCHFRGGVVRQSDKTIKWWEDKPCKLADGMNPTVALKDRTVIFIHESSSFGSYQIFYRIGEIRENKIWATEEHHLEALDGYKEISVAVNSSGQVLFACRSKIGYHLYYTVGQLVGSELKKISSLQTYGDGYFNHVSLIDNGCVVGVHENWHGKEVMLITGKICKDSVDWEEEQRVDNGYRINAALNNSNKMVVVIKQNIMGHGEGALMCKFGTCK